MKSIFTHLDVLVFAFLLSVCTISCKNKNEVKKADNLIQREYDPNARMTDFQGAMEYEFIMLRNPTTGTIPEGIFEQEKIQAREILERQQLAGRLAVNPYTFQGPNNLGGRTRTIAYDVRYDGAANRIIMAGGVSGGVYKSTDDGATWVRKSPTGDHFSCTSIAQDPRPGGPGAGVFYRDTWYYVVGEASGNSAGVSGAFYLGNGVYKSTDNGETWARLPASNTTALETFSVPEDLISKVIVDPTDGYVYIACDANIRRSTDGGATWATVLTDPAISGSKFTDIVVSSAGRLYASFSGKCDSGVDGVWASPPGPLSGDPASWTRIAGAGFGGSPVGWDSEPTYGRVVLAIAPSDEKFLYALYWKGVTSSCAGVPAPEAELFRWDDIAGTWTDLSATMPDVPAVCLDGNDPFACQTGYDLVVAVKPDDASTVFIGGTNAYRSSDAGLTWTRIGGYAGTATYALYTDSHPDIHSFVFQPGSPLIMLCGNDGGIQRTTDNTAGTVVWSQINIGYRTYQFYYVTLDPRTGNAKVMGGTQDNGTTRNTSPVFGTTFESLFGGDGVSVGLTDPAATGGIQYEYVGFQFGEIFRRDATAVPNTGTYITPTGESGSGLFITLYKLDADNTDILYYANDERLHRSTTASAVTSATWTAMTGVAAAVSPTHTITALATTRGPYAPATSSLFIGASDIAFPFGPPKLYRLDDPGFVAAPAPPVDISGAGFPAGAFLSSIAVNPRNDDTIIVTFSNYGVTSVFWTGTANSGAPVWTAVEGTGPGKLDIPSFRSSAIAITSAGVEYFVGTSVGMYTSIGLPGIPALISWTKEGPTEMGNAVVSNLALRPVDGKLLLGTHGYGMWFTMLSLPALPVTLTEFKGALQNNKTALLQWTTSFEQNSKHFELEKSFDGTSYRTIATIAAAGNSTSSRQYSYTDREPLTEKNYYRLRSVDMDNHSKLSTVVLLKLAGAMQDIQVLGNPFKNNTLVVRFVRSPDEKGELRLNDMSGRLVARRTIGPGEQLVSFNIPSAAAGSYILQAVINGKTYTAKVMKE